MLRKVLAITGKPGLYEIVSQGNKTLIVEDITAKKRLPVHPRDKVVSLGDITMYTENGDTPLGEILTKVYEGTKGETIDVKALVKEGTLKDEFGRFVPDFDRERVYDNDVKKLFSWYNLLRQAGWDKFISDNDEPVEEKDKD